MLRKHLGMGAGMTIRTSTALAVSAVVMLVAAPYAVSAAWSLHMIGVATLGVAAMFRLSND